MKRFILALGISSVLSGCAGLLDKQDPICSGVAMVGGQETTVQIYGIRKVVEQTQYRAGYPFNWQWVAALLNKSDFG
ncbi:cor protein [Enterobacter hormaechei]|uniref:phage exclusion lipoprotein Cor n=1 Tax=Enterobacter hormaechei TaxID=158836 RepID=UPI000D21F8E4|nr:cor protein [Enterobacter hormaechei]AVZ14803.1 cor protein [Enterobacter hormaechei]